MRHFLRGAKDLRSITPIKADARSKIKHGRHETWIIRFRQIREGVFSLRFHQIQIGSCLLDVPELRELFAQAEEIRRRLAMF